MLKYLRFILPLLLLVFVFGKDFYSNYKAEQRHQQLKSVFHELLFDGDHRTNVRSVVLTNEVVSVVVNIQNTIVTDEVKSKFSANAHNQMPEKVCSSIGLRQMMQNGTPVSIDVKANSNVSITNVRVTWEDCT
ncbi:hypothetical protein [Vibrio hangzhouensis]|uniref:hypothetical protein n=1 Tax=Vibrio hangzhouensis TaxID=462991 RepID=UPI000CDEA45C|nr:hypothetical protein [Vibrio hangzhouensis]